MPLTLTGPLFSHLLRKAASLEAAFCFPTTSTAGESYPHVARIQQYLIELDYMWYIMVYG